MMRVVAHAARSGRAEVARAIVRAAPTVVAWSFYSPDAPRAAAGVAWLHAHAPAALHVAGGGHATADPAATCATASMS